MNSSHELQIHYGAPSLVRNDGRWRELAHNIVNFQPAKTWRITAVRAAENQPTESERHQHVVDGGAQTVPGQGQGNLVDARAIQPLLAPSSRVTQKRKHGLCGDCGDHSRAKRSKRTTFARTKQGLNPLFKSPVTAYLSVSKPKETSPDHCKTANVSTKVVLVPCTTNSKSRRLRAEVATDCPRRNIFQQSSSLSPNKVEETSFELHSFSSTQVLSEGSSAAVAGGVLDSIEFQTQCLTADTYPTSSQTSSRVETTETEVISSMKESDTLTRGADRCAALESSPMYMGSLTQIPRLQMESSPLVQRTSRVTANIFRTPEFNVASKVAKRDILGPLSSPVADVFASPLESGSSTPMTSKISALPRRLFCPSPTSQHEICRSFVPQSLRDLANKFDLVDKFRPEKAVERIKNGDRGYWKLLIRITNLATVATSRRSPLSSSQWSDKKFFLTLNVSGLADNPTESRSAEEAMRQQYYPSKDSAAFTPWTADEFVSFWMLMRKIIRGGRAGYDVHATISGDLVETQHEIDLEVRFYGYAEALSHMWCILCVLSNNTVANMPVQWMRPGQGMLIKMTGHAKRGGSVGRWVEESPGVEGNWGLEKVLEDRN